ncbi:MAG: ABC transporter ATP-binding protein, partial [Kiritimatiellae bacterium]|nr:ABC transporter ATP-binding protein [Kiritimatiellia bacterium]
DDYVRQRAVAPDRGTDRRAEAGREKQPPRRDDAPKPRERKLSYNERRELDALPGRIDSLEGELKEIREALADGSVYRTDPARAKALSDRLPLAEAELEAAVDRWAELAERSGE